MKKILVLILLAYFLVHVAQLFTGFIKVKPLGGVIHTTEVPNLSMASWFSGAFQDSLTNRLDEAFGFRPLYIRLFNQIDFSLYRKIHGYGVVLGKNNYLYENWYVLEYGGYGLVGIEKITETLNKLKVINDYLQKNQTKLLVVLAPGKPYYYPEYLPDESISTGQSTNYYDYMNVLSNSGLPWIDINNWFIKAKDTTTYPLFSKTGTHWSDYGAALVADSILKYTQWQLDRPMNSIRIKELKSKPITKTADTDLNNVANLIFPIKDLNLMYPILEIDSVISPDESPERIVIGDSFFWNLFGLKSNNCYKITNFWYYYSSIFPQWENYQPTINEVDVLQKIRETDQVVIMVTTAGLYKFGYGFIEDVYKKIIKENESSLSVKIESSMSGN
ncbi:MAG: hypothetical protein R2750_09615 [Bacteroidales bacterium]